MINKLFAGAPRGCPTTTTAAPTNFIRTTDGLLGGAEMLCINDDIFLIAQTLY